MGKQIFPDRSFHGSFFSFAFPWNFFSWKGRSSTFSPHTYLLPQLTPALSRETLVMFLRFSSRFPCMRAFSLILSSPLCVQHQETKHETKNYSLGKFLWVRHDDCLCQNKFNFFFQGFDVTLSLPCLFFFFNPRQPPVLELNFDWLTYQHDLGISWNMMSFWIVSWATDHQIRRSVTKYRSLVGKPTQTEETIFFIFKRV